MRYIESFAFGRVPMARPTPRIVVEYTATLDGVTARHALPELKTACAGARRSNPHGHTAIDTCSDRHGGMRHRLAPAQT